MCLIVKIEKILEKSLYEWKKNIYISVPFIIESIAIFGFMNMLGFIGMTYNIDQQTLNAVISLSPFLVSAFMLLIILSSYLEAVGLGAIHASMKKRKGLWVYGKEHGLHMFQITTICLLLYFILSLPSMFFLNSFFLMYFGVIYLMGVIFFLSLALFFSKYAMIASRRKPWKAIERSARIFFKKPFFVMKMALIIFVINFPVFVISLFLPILGAFLIGFFTQPWTAYFIFRVYEVI